jgi:Gas vesicle synthesis protein GvpL/GvpF
VAEPGRYLYAVCRGLPKEAADGILGLDGARIDLVVEDSLVGVVSQVDLEEYGEEGLRRNLERLDWLEHAARGHDAVVQAVATSAPTAPTRLATIFLDDKAVRRRLREQHDAISAALDRVEGNEEWSVKVLMPAGRPEPEAVPMAASGADYLRLKRREQEARTSGAGLAHLTAEQVHDLLIGVAVASRRLPPQDPRLAGHEGTMVANTAYLVGQERGDEFLGLVRTSVDAHPEVVIDARGPWPPYSFAMLDTS